MSNVSLVIRSTIPFFDTSSIEKVLLSRFTKFTSLGVRTTSVKLITAQEFSDKKRMKNIKKPEKFKFKFFCFRMVKIR